MAKRWVYLLMPAALIGMVIAAGSAAAAQGKAAQTLASDSVSPVAVVIQNHAFPNFQWTVVTHGSDTGPALLLSVPPSQRFQIDDVTISYGGAIRNDAVMYRGTGGTSELQYTIFTSGGRYEHSFQNLILSGGEVLRVQSVGSSMATTWTITGHMIQ